jgi:hypothetical protein
VSARIGRYSLFGKYALDALDHVQQLGGDEVDKEIQSRASKVADDFDRDVDELDQTGFESDDEGEPSFMDHVADVNVETLIAAYHSIRNTWRQETLVSAQRIPSLIRGTTFSYQVYAVAQQRRRKVRTPSDLIGDLFY